MRSQKQLRKTVVGFLMSVCPSARPPARPWKKLSLRWTNCHEILYSGLKLTNVEGKSVVKIGQK